MTGAGTRTVIPAKAGIHLILLAATFVLSACGQPVPQERSAYVGEWPR